VIRDFYGNPADYDIYFHPKPGHWYLGVKCHFCGSPIFIAEVPNQRPEKAPPAKGIYFRIVCVNEACERVDSYQPEEIVSFLWPGKATASRKN
jgi:hypothetical protein